MDILTHFETTLAKSSISTTLFQRTDGRGAEITIRSFDTQRAYGRRLRKIELRCLLTFVGELTVSEDLFNLLEEVTRNIQEDQTAGGDYSAVVVSPWTSTVSDKNYVTFASIIKVEE